MICRVILLITLLTMVLPAPRAAQRSRSGSPPPVAPSATPREKTTPQDKTPPKEEEDIKLGADLVTFNLMATDGQGRRLTDLKQGEVVVFDDGVPQQIAFFSTTEEPFHVVLLIDVSGSTQSQVAVIQRAARRFLDQLRQGDQVAIVSFAEAPTLEADFTANRAKLERAIDRLIIPPPSRAGTSFYEAMRIMVEQVLEPTEGRKAFVALTDGVDSTSTAAYEDVLPLVTRAGATGYFIQVDSEEATLAKVMKSRVETGAVRLSPQQLRKYVTAMPQISDPGRYEDPYRLSPLERREVNEKLYALARDELKELAHKSGGRVYPIDQLEEASGAFKQIADEIRLQYSVGYYPKPERRDGRWHELRVEVKRPGAAAHARPGYTAPKP